MTLPDEISHLRLHGGHMTKNYPRDPITGKKDRGEDYLTHAFHQERQLFRMNWIDAYGGYDLSLLDKEVSPDNEIFPAVIPEGSFKPNFHFIKGPGMEPDGTLTPENRRHSAPARQRAHQPARQPSVSSRPKSPPMPPPRHMLENVGGSGSGSSSSSSWWPQAETHGTASVASTIPRPAWRLVTRYDSKPDHWSEARWQGWLAATRDQNAWIDPNADEDSNYQGRSRHQ